MPDGGPHSRQQESPDSHPGRRRIAEPAHCRRTRALRKPTGDASRQGIVRIRYCDQAIYFDYTVVEILKDQTSLNLLSVFFSDF